MGHGVTGIPPDSGSGESRFESWWPSTAVDVGHGADGPCGCSSAGRAPPCQGGGRGVEARHPLARLAQLAERCCDTAEVVGSIPSARTSLAPRCEAQPPPRWGARPCSPNGRGVRFRTGRLGVRLPPGAHTRARRGALVPSPLLRWRHRGSMAQLVAQVLCKHPVRGSSPRGSTTAGTASSEAARRVVREHPGPRGDLRCLPSALRRRSGGLRWSSPRLVDVAQLVALLVVVQAVAGSSPVIHPPTRSWAC